MAPTLVTPTGVTVKVSDNHAKTLHKQGYKNADAKSAPDQEPADPDENPENEDTAAGEEPVNAEDTQAPENEDADAEQNTASEKPAPSKAKSGGARGRAKSS